MPVLKEITHALFRTFFPRTGRGRQARTERHTSRGVRFYSDGAYTESEREFLKAIEVAGEPGAEPEFLATTLDQIGDFYHSTGNYSRAEPVYTRSLEIRRGSRVENHEKFFAAMNNLALLFYAEGRYREAEPLYKELIELIGQSLGVNTREMAICLENYAALLRRLSRNDESDQLRSQARAIRQVLKTPGNPVER